MSANVERQQDIEEATRLASKHLIESWLSIDTLLPEHLGPIRNGLKRSRTRSSRGTALTTNFMMFLCVAGILHRDGHLTMGQLSRATSISQSTTTRMVQWMVENGYVYRIQDAKDRRVMHVGLTDNGLELLLAAKAQLREFVSGLLERLPAVQRVAVMLSLSDVMSAWQSVQEKHNAPSDALK
jgi:DNA-binding MarR family transcriptional regulator